MLMLVGPLGMLALGGFVFFLIRREDRRHARRAGR
jgi:uncharacterized protein involved in exopolysaccharide biosynthesis